MLQTFVTCAVVTNLYHDRHKLSSEFQL